MKIPDIGSEYHIVADVDDLPEEGYNGDVYIVDPRPLGCEIGVFVYNDERHVWECVVNYEWDPETNEIKEMEMV